MLNIKLSKTPPLPTHLGGGPTPGAICGLWRVTWKHPPAKTSPSHPKGQVPERLGQAAVPSRGAEVQPPPAIGDKGRESVPGAPVSASSPPLLRLPLQWLLDPPPLAPHHSDTQSPAPVPTLTDTGSLPCAMCAGRKNPHLYTPSLHHQARLPRVRALDKEARDRQHSDLAPSPWEFVPLLQGEESPDQLGAPPLQSWGGWQLEAEGCPVSTASLSRGGTPGTLAQSPDPPLAPGDP